MEHDRRGEDRAGRLRAERELPLELLEHQHLVPVSYTHLTLPTSDLV